MAAICLVLMVVASLAALRYAFYRPAVFPLFLMIVGPLEFGAEADAGMNLSAIWLLMLIACAVLALFRMPGPRVRLSGIEMLYVAFLAWAVLGAYRAPDMMFSVRMFLKLLFPFLVLLLARRAVLSRQFPQIRVAFKWMMVSSFIAFLCVGGFTQRFLPSICWTASCVFWALAAFADHAAVLGVASLISWRIFKNKWYLIYGLLAGISPVLAGIRTGVGAFFIGASIFVLTTFRRTIAIPMLLGCYVLFAAALLFVPDIKNKMFHNAGSVDSASLLKNPGDISLDNVNTDGRQMLWTAAMTSLFDPNPVMGSGLGATQQFMYTQTFTVIKVVHSGYVELLCDTGVVGMAMYLLVLLGIVLRCGAVLLVTTDSRIRLLCLCTLCSIPALLVCMGFDNVINYCLPAGQYPFVFAGLALGYSPSSAGIKLTASTPVVAATASRPLSLTRW